MNERFFLSLDTSGFPDGIAALTLAAAAAVVLLLVYVLYLEDNL